MCGKKLCALIVIILMTVFNLKAQDPCNPAYPIAGLGQAYQQTFINSGTGVWNMNFCGYSSSLYEKVYSINVPYEATYKIIASGYGQAVYGWEQGTCNQNSWICISSISLGGGSGTYGSMYWTPGLYYILLKNINNASHTFYIICEPNAPLITATTVSSNQINLSWNDVDGETGYEVTRKLLVGGTWATIGTTAAGITTFSDVGLTPNVGYCYGIKAFNNDASSVWSNTACATTFPTTPLTPINLTTTSSVSGQIDLSWTDVAGETGYKIFRKLSPSGAYAQVATVTQNQNTYSDNDTALIQNSEYCYKIKAYNSGGESGFSNESCAIVNPNISPAPTNLTATAMSASQINLAWNDVLDEAGYIIYRSPSLSGTYTQLAMVNANVVNYSNIGLSANTQYCYKVKSYNTSGQSSFSSAACANTFMSAPMPPSVPSNLTALPIGCGQIELNWNDVSTEEGYNIYRADSINGTYLFLACTDNDQTAYMDINLPFYTNFCYKVKAYNTGGESAFSNDACDVTLSVKNYEGADNLIKVYPNPATDILIIETQGQQVTLYNTVKITDVQGKVIIDQIIQQRHTEIDISSLTKGIYLLKFDSKDGIVNKKFVKE